MIRKSLLKDAEIDSLRGELNDAIGANDRLSTDYRNSSRLLGEYQRENEELRKKLSEAIEVIKFYGNSENYHERKEDTFDYILSDTSIENDCLYGGKRARDYLKENL